MVKSTLTNLDPDLDVRCQKLVLFGAGKIGRSFIGQLFSRGGYEVVFIDVFRPMIDALNERKNYNVVIKSEKEVVLNVKHVRGVLATDEQAVISEIATADIMAVSIGQQALPGAIPLIAKGLEFRMEMSCSLPLDIIIAENLRNAADYFKTWLMKFLPSDYPFEELVGLVETSIGKMVPILLKKDIEDDILQVFAEPYNTLIVDKAAFKNHLPVLEGLAPKDNIKAWVDRKLFIHNLGHATAAYLGFRHFPRFIYLYEVLEVPSIKNAVRETMLQSADILLKKYPGEFTTEALTVHTDDLIARFQNRALGDTVYRVGCDLKRKLNAQDRLAGAIHLALELNMPFDKIMEAFIAGCEFKATDESGNRLEEDIVFAGKFEKYGIRWALTEMGGFDDNEHDIIYELLFNNNLIRF